MTLRRRIIAGVAAILALALGAAFVALRQQVKSQLTTGIDQDLRADMDAFATAVARGDSPQRYLAGQPFRATARLLYSAASGAPPLTNEPTLLDGDDAPLFRTAPGLSTRQVSDVGPLRLLVRRAANGTRLGVGEPLEPVDRALEGVDHALLFAAALGLAVAILAGAGLSIGVTRPLRRMARVADAVDGGDLAPRMAEHRPHDEIGRLADAFDTMLDRLAEAFARQQVFVAEASHELRTPLTIIRGQLEVLAAAPEPDPEDVRRVERIVTAEVTHMSRLVDDLLVLAAPAVHLQPVALRPFLTDLAEALAGLANGRLELGDVADVTVRADPDRLGQAVRNLVRNAVEHAGPGGRVCVSAVRAAGRLVAIDVDDDGPGIPAAQRELVFDRFHRIDPAGGGDGAGLGLAIVRAVAEAHDGRAYAADSDLGGARLRIELPEAA